MNVVRSFLIVSLLPTLAHAVPYDIDTGHSAVGFSVRHMMVSNVKGSFGKFTGTVDVDEKKFQKSTIDVTIDASSIDTNDEKRDAHLKNADFFDVEKYPTITFKSKSIKKRGKSRYDVLGDLTMHGVTKEVTLKIDELSGPVKGPWGNIRRGARATAQLNRKDFGITWNKNLDGGGLVVGEKIKIELEIELTQKKEG